MSATPDIPRDSAQEIVVPGDALRDLVVKLLVKQSMFAAEAEIAADRMLEADLRGIHSHGSRALSRYLQSMEMGNIDPRAQVLTVNDSPATAVLDGSRGIGHVAATKAMQLAIQKAKEVGTGTVAVKNSHHLGAASVYTLMAIEAGMIGFCTTSTAYPTVAAYGSKQAAVANNALAWGAPTKEGPPFVLDMACGETSWGKIESFGMFGRSLPGGWALDENGNETTNAKEAKTILPASGARGFGLAFLCSLLAGPLVGGKMPIHKTRAPDVEHSEHFLYAIDPAHFGDLDRFHDRLGSASADIRDLEPADDFDKVRLPGELEWERAQEWKDNGIPLHKDHVEMLEAAAKSNKVEAPW